MFSVCIFTLAVVIFVLLAGVNLYCIVSDNFAACLLQQPIAFLNVFTYRSDVVVRLVETLWRIHVED